MNAPISAAVRASSASSSCALTTSSIQPATRGMSDSVRPRVVMAAVPSRRPDGSKGLRVSKGTVLWFSSTPAASSALAAGLPATPLFVSSMRMRWVSVPPETRSNPRSSSASASAPALATTWWA